MKIQTMDIDTVRVRRRTQVEDIPEEIKQVRARGRRYTARRSGGTHTKRTMTQYLEMLFVRNELEAMRGSPLTRPQLQHNLQREFPQRRLDRLNNHTQTLGSFQKEYNKGVLYAAQPRPILISFRYDEEGYIVESARANQYISFARCRELCAEFLTADPRFFSPSELIELRKRFSLGEDPVIYWSIPTHEEVKALEEKIGKAPYNCLRFPQGLGLQKEVA